MWIQIRPDILSGLIWVQTVCKGYQQTAIIAHSEELNTKQLVDTIFWLKPWLKLFSFGSNFSYLVTVLATTNSEPGKALCKDYILNFFQKPLMHIEIEEIGLDDEQERKSAISRIEEGQGQSKKELIDKDSKMFERFTAISPGMFK